MSYITGYEIDDVLSNFSNLTDQQKMRVVTKMEKKANQLDSYGEHLAATFYRNATSHLVKGNTEYAKLLFLARMIPPTMQEFLESDEYLGGKINLWEPVKRDLIRHYPHIMSGEQEKELIINNSCLGTAKSFSAIVRFLYRMCVLNCFEKPHFAFKSFDASVNIVLYLISAKPKVTEKEIYGPIRTYVEMMPFFQKSPIQYDRRMESEIIFDNKVKLVPAKSNDPTNMLSVAILDGLMDEANFFEVISNSKKSDQGANLFDQAQTTFEILRKRRTTRFFTNHLKFGGTYILSSTLHERDFTSRLIGDLQSGKLTESHEILRYRKWDVAPENMFVGGWFDYRVPTKDLEPLIIDNLKEYESVEGKVQGRVERVPEQYKSDFQINPYKAQRDHLGIPYVALEPFIHLSHKVHEAMIDKPLLTTKDIYVLAKGDGYPTVAKDGLPSDLATPRYVHIDLSTTSDRAAIAISKVVGSKYDEASFSHKPIVEVEYAIAIEPTPAHPIDIAKIRTFVSDLKHKYKMNILKVTFDQFQSQESRITLHNQGICTELLSVDRTPAPYEQLKSSIYDGTVKLCKSALLADELCALTVVNRGKTYKVDHPATSSKDLADAVCGSFYSAYFSGESKQIHYSRMLSESNKDFDVDPTDFDFEFDTVDTYEDLNSSDTFFNNRELGW